MRVEHLPFNQACVVMMWLFVIQLANAIHLL